MSYRKDSFSDKELTILATDIINDLSTSQPPIDHNFILFRNVDSTSYIADDYTHQSPSPFIQSYNSSSTTFNNTSPQYTINNTTAKDSLSITPHISMDSNFSDSIPTLPPTPTFNSNLKIPKIKTYTFAGNKKNAIKQRLKQNRKKKHKTPNFNKKSPSSPFNPPPQHVQTHYISPKNSYTNSTDIDVTLSVSPLPKNNCKKLQHTIPEFDKNKYNSRKSVAIKSNKKKKQKRNKNSKKNKNKKMSDKLDQSIVNINTIDLRQFSNPLSYSPFYRRRNNNGEVTSTTPVPRSRKQSKKCKVRANSVVSTRNPMWNNCDLY